MNFMALRSEESLQKLFQERKAINQRKKEKQKLKKQKEKQEKLLQLKKALKEAQEQEKKEKMEYIKALAQKASPKPLKQASIHIAVYNNRYVNRELSEECLYLTREQLMAAEERGEGSIRWNVWNSLVKKVRENLM